MDGIISGQLPETAACQVVNGVEATFGMERKSHG
jgi:hypothetical protein